MTIEQAHFVCALIYSGSLSETGNENNFSDSKTYRGCIEFLVRRILTPEAGEVLRYVSREY